MKRKNIKALLKTTYEKHWINKMTHESKMRTYRKLKHHLNYEKYLDIINKDYAKAFSRFRTSAHNLAIERGRYTKPYTPPNQRICPHCPNTVQDEHHFLMSCSKYSVERDVLFHNISEICPMFGTLSAEEKFIFMLTAEGSIIKEVAKFVYRNLP